MESFIDNLCHFTEDKYIFPVTEGTFILFAVFAFAMDLKETILIRLRKGSFLNVTRSKESMARLHSTYVALAFLAVLITLNVRFLENHRVIFVFINVGLLAYLCFYNGWFRNKLFHWVQKSSAIEEKSV